MCNSSRLMVLLRVSFCACALFSCSEGPSPNNEQATDTDETDPQGGDTADTDTKESDTGRSTESNLVDTETDTDTGTDVETDNVDLYGFAGGCFSLSDSEGRYLARTEGAESYQFLLTEGAEDEGHLATPFYWKASDLATYLLYDPQGGYVVAEDGPLVRETHLESDISLLDDSYISGAEWVLQEAEKDSDGTQFYHLRHRKTDMYLSLQGLADDQTDAIKITIVPAVDCAEHPELTLDADGEVTPRIFDDGSVFGIAETHTHVLTNFGFGGGNIYHGAPFHRLGVEHALPDCSEYHGSDGRKDFFGYGYDAGGNGLDAGTLISLLLFGKLSAHNHDTAGYPDFTEWPSAPYSSTHQTMYYMWLKRAWMGGLRFLVQHATSNSAICEFMVGAGYQRARYSCNDMVAVDRILAETYAMERYIDAQEGGPGKGFFRIVKTPLEAREVILDGKLAVILGIETSNLFNCFSVPRAGFPVCDESYIVEQLDKYYELGVRAIFPVHKYDNAFSAGDGHRDFIELGNFINSGHWSNFVEEDCPESPSVFDKGRVFFGGMNGPRDDYFARPPVNMTGFQDNPILKLLPYVLKIMADPLEGDFCQNAGLTYLGEFLMKEAMKRGMILEIDHFNKRAYNKAFEILEEHDYPAAATHGSVGPEGRVYALGGVSMFNFGRCRDPNKKGTMISSMKQHLKYIEQYGWYPGVGIGLDLNGFNGGRKPRFGERGCGPNQDDPVTYPFTSYAGDVTFTPPRVGNRDLNFNTEGLVHVGLLPEMIEDARRDAESDDDLEPLFRSAEAYLRTWERSEERALDLREEL